MNPRLPTVIRHLSSVTFFTLSILSACAQDSPSVKSLIDKSAIVIGEQLRFGIDVNVPAGMTLQLSQPDTFPHFVMIGEARLDSIVSPGGTRYHQEWKLTSFDSGLFKIPALPVDIAGHRYFSDSLLVEVGYGNPDSVKDYHDIRGIIDVENPAVKYIFWILLALTLLAIFLFVWFSPKLLQREVVSPEEKPGRPPMPAFDEAMASLEELKRIPPTDATAIKKYYSAMNDVLRVYLSRSLGLKTMEQTNEELILQLSGLGLQQPDFSRLAGTLRMSDFVKFAKYLPDHYDNERNLEVIRSSIVLIHEMRK